jgi:LDH2 family malate/lactate/ureidoglycolate dehydrogenase
MSETQTKFYRVEDLRTFMTQVFVSCEVTEEDALLASDVLATADLWGIDSHGIARLRAYFEMLRRGLINPRPNLKVVRERAATMTVDGDNGLGLVVGPKANELALKKAEEAGTGWVSVRHSNHFGIAGYYTVKALEREMLGIVMTNTPPLVSPLWGAGKMLGTNPISVAFPGLEEPPVVIDMATSAISYGVAETAARANRELPEGLVADHEGAPSTNPEAVTEGGSLLPLGYDRAHGGHKGYCLSAMVDILCGVLSGANWGPFVPPFPHYLKQPERSVGQGLGHLFGAFQLESFVDAEEFKRGIDDWVRTFRAARPAPGTDGPLIPGDPERDAAARRQIEGVALSPSVVADLRFVATESGLSFD